MKKVLIFLRSTEEPIIIDENEIMHISTNDKWLDFKDGKVKAWDYSTGERFVLLPERLTEQNGAKRLLMEKFTGLSWEFLQEMYEKIVRKFS